MSTNHNAIWEPYLKPTRKVHDSGYRCFECGYLQLSESGNRAAKKIIIATYVDHISNYLFPEKSVNLDFDLLRDGHIRVFSSRGNLYWRIPGWSDAMITSEIEKASPSYDILDELYNKRDGKGNTVAEQLIARLEESGVEEDK